MWTAVQGNHSGIVNHFAFNHHVIGGLHDLDVVVIERGQHRCAGRSTADHRQTALAVTKILRVLRVVCVEVFGPFDQQPLRVRRQRRNSSVGRINNQGGASVWQDVTPVKRVEVGTNLQLERLARIDDPALSKR